MEEEVILPVGIVGRKYLLIAVYCIYNQVSLNSLTPPFLLTILLHLCLWA